MEGGRRKSASFYCRNMKTYRSNGIISINVMIAGKKKHYLFRGIQHGLGMLVVKNAEVAKAIEKHEWFGEKFWLHSDDGKKGSEVEQELMGAVKGVPAAKKQGTEAEEQTEAAAGDAQPRMAENRGGEEPEAAEEAGDPEAGGGRMEFESFGDAREWVNENLGVEMKNLMSKAAVVEAAAAKGVEIVFVK